MPQAKGDIVFASTTFNPDSWVAKIAALAPDRNIIFKTDPAHTLAHSSSVHYAVVWKHEHGSLKQFENLKVIFSLGAGVDHILNDPDLPDLPIVRAISPDLTARMSEYIVWQVLDHHRKGALFRQLQREKIWQTPDYQPAASAVNIGILGLGELGRDAGVKLNMLGFNVHGWSRSQKHIEHIKCHSGADGLDNMLSRADIIVCLLPHTKETERILDKTLFRKFKTSGPLGAPILINAGRGALQNEEDIIKSLDEGILGAASLDVFQTEPLAHNNPIWEHPKITVTPHIAADSDPDALIGKIIEQIETFEADGTLDNLVDPNQGY